VPSKLVKLQIDEVSLVDRPANQGALVALAKRDGSKPVGGTGDLALPQYRPNTDPKVPVYRKRKKDQMRLKDMRNMVSKGDLPDVSVPVVWDGFFTKSDKQGGSRFEREARVGKMLEADYQNGGQLIEYLKKATRR
jgi:hypothetical protein